MINPNLLQVTARAGINQIRGINPSGATGSGIPKHVTNVSTSMANASVGSTSTISVTFRRDPADTNFGGVTVLVKGYQGNQTPTQVASGTDSPISFILNNTGEALSVTVQANGNGGSAPITTAPTAGLTLPKSTSGVGTTTTTSALTLKTNGVTNSTQTLLNLKPGSNITLAESAGAVTITGVPAISGSPGVGQLAKFASPATTVTGADLTGDATTSGTVAVTVGKIQGTSISATAPFDQQVLKYFSSQAAWLPEFVSGPWFSIQAAGVTTSWVMQGMYAGVALFNVGTSSNVAATASLPPGFGFVTAASAGVSTGWNAGNAASAGGAPIQFWREVQWTVSLSQTATTRIWMGLGDNALSNSTGVTLRSDAPSMNFVGFRYSTNAGDTKYQCCTFSGASSTVTPESTASHVDTGSHKFALRWDGTNVLFLIDNVQVGSISTNVPTTAMFPNFYMDNVGAANARGFTFYNLFGVGKTY